MFSAILIVLTICFTINAAPEIFTEKINSIPDYYQRDKEYGGFPRGGSVYCGPVTASNSLFWFSKNGYPDIVQSTDNAKKDQYNLISELGSSNYINTQPGGASPDMICSGVKKYLADKDYKDAIIKFFGWRPVQEEYRANSRIPDFGVAKEALIKNNAVWLNIGWYKYNEQKNEYKRTGGHWVTLVGYGHNGKKYDSDALIIHDPETRWRENDYLKVQKITGGKLTGKMKNLPQDATGYTRFSTGGNYGIIEGMVILEMPQRNREVVSRPD